MGKENGTLNGAMQDTLITAQTSQGMEIHGKLVHFTRFSVAFEVFNPGLVLQTSEILADFKIILHEQPLYSGRAVLRGLVDTGTTITCEATLDETGWIDVDFFPPAGWEKRVRANYEKFQRAALQNFSVLPEFKVAVADLQMLLTDLRIWLEQVELGIRSRPDGDRQELELKTIQAIESQILNTALQGLERFEMVAQTVTPDARPAHMNYMKRQIHPLVLCAPFIHRAFFKPLGYAGDYEMVNMMLRSPYEGSSLFAKILNRIFLSTPPVKAHQDRLVYLTELLKTETLRTLQKKKVARIFNLGCGPAKEIQDFLRHQEVGRHTEFTLVDFNEETLAYTTRVLSNITQRYASGAKVHLIKKSVNQLIKEAFKLQSFSQKFDVVYCAGLFDYLPDPVCKRLLNIFYEMVAPGGFLAATNVDDSNPSKGWMEYILDWHLVYRDGPQFAKLIPDAAPPDSSIVRSVGAGVNIFLEVRKPENV